MKLTLTKSSVESLPPAPAGKSQELYYDLRLPGFGVYVTPKGIKTYFAEGRLNNKTVRRKIGRHGAVFPEAAREEARAILFAMSKGESIGKAEKPAKTLRDAVLAYISERSGTSGQTIKEKTQEGYKWLLNTPLEAWNNTQVTSVDKELCRTMHKKITEDSGPTVANNCMRLLRATFNFYDVEPNPVLELSKKRLWNPDKRRTRFIESDKVSLWVANAEALPITSRCAVLMMLFLGLRKMEVLSLKKEQLHDDAVWLGEGDTKNSDAHMVPIGPYLLQRLRLLMNIEGKWLFPSRESKKGHMCDPRKAIASLGVSISPHDLRRTFVSHLNALEPAPSMYTIKRLMNHRQATTDVTAGYIQIEEKKLREVITQLEQSMVGTIQTTGLHPVSDSRSASPT